MSLGINAKRTGLPLAVLTAFGLLAAVSTAFAHIDVPLKDAAGAPVTGSTPYSPKVTCGGCHFDCTTGLPSDVRSTWCTSGQQKDCSTEACPDYQYGSSSVTKNQGIIKSDGTITYVNYTVSIPTHGAATGKHSTQGRNEELASVQRTIWSAPATISSPGMYGRY